MDTAQRGMGLGWPEAKALIGRALEAAKGRAGGADRLRGGTDHLTPGPEVTVDEVIRAYEEQIEAIEALGGRIILMASRALAAAATGPGDYVRVYDRVLAQVREPVIIHWLGEMFDPALEGYWGADDHEVAMETCLEVIAAHAGEGGRDQDLAARRRRRRSRCAGGCRRACGCIPATTSTMPS